MADGVFDPDACGIAAFAYEMGVLKRTRRSGWWHAGVRDPESVAEHSLRVAQLAALIAAEEGADPARSAYLGLWHDSQETRTGDLPHSARPYLRSPPNQAITADQSPTCPRRPPARLATPSRSSRPSSPPSPGALRTPTGWSACCRRSSTRTPATNVSRPGSTPPAPSSPPAPPPGSPTPPCAPPPSPGATVNNLRQQATDTGGRAATTAPRSGTESVLWPG